MATLPVALPPRLSEDELITLLSSGDLSCIWDLLSTQPLDFFVDIDYKICAWLLHRLLEMKAKAMYVERVDHMPFLKLYNAVTAHIRANRADTNRLFGELLYILANLDAESNRVFFRALPDGTYVPSSLKVAHYFGNFEKSLDKDFQAHIQDIKLFIGSAAVENRVEYSVEIFQLFRTAFPDHWTFMYYQALRTPDVA